MKKTYITSLLLLAFSIFIILHSCKIKSSSINDPVTDSKLSTEIEKSDPVIVHEQETEVISIGNTNSGEISIELDDAIKSADKTITEVSGRIDGVEKTITDEGEDVIEESILKTPLSMSILEHSPAAITSHSLIAISMDYSGTASYSYTSPSTYTWTAGDSRLTRDTEFNPIAIEGVSEATNNSVNLDFVGMLTAGEINDFQKWKMWEDIADNELAIYRNIWKIEPADRYSVMIHSNAGNPVIDCKVTLVAKNGSTIWQSRTNNSGRAELWQNFILDSQNERVDQIKVEYNNQVYQIERPKAFRNGVNYLEIPAECNIPDFADILFTVDATGSMQDEISYLQAELVDVIEKARSKFEDIKFQTAGVFYRDHGDTYLTVQSDFSDDIRETNSFVAEQFADGGGDGPEAVDEAMQVGISQLNWSQNARARIMFLILDAPPHEDDQSIKRIVECIKSASAKGIRIVPLVASGGGYDLDKSLEYLMRCCALGTNGTYAFLTDDSGIGDSHTAPSTDEFEVESLNDLLLRIIEESLFVPDCNVEEFVNAQEPIDTSSVVSKYELDVETAADSLSDDSLNHVNEPILQIFTLRCYPNPASQYFMAETSEKVSEMFLADNSGKIIERIVPVSELTRIEVQDLPTGIYYLKAWIDDKWASAKIIVTHI